ncbi:MAG: magnesium transporter [Oscillospiraceae bacterium]|nr:magnesium transporter [Oscillospiraceae bacterium]
MNKEIFERLLQDKQYKAIKSIFDTLNPVDIAELFPELDEKDMVILFRLIPKERAAEVFTYLGQEEEQVLLLALTDTEIKGIMDDMFIDDAVDVIEEMPANVVERMLALSGEKRTAINTILNYPEDSAGSIMTLEYISLLPSMTIGDALKKVKSAGIRSETVYTCYVVEKHKLLGIITAKDLLTCDDSEKISDVMETNIISVKTHTDKEEVAALFNKYDFLSLPVVDNEFCIVGIVTVDDAMDVLQEEAEEDFQKMAAITPTDKPYLRTTPFSIWKSRIPWLLILMVSATFTGIIISSFEDALSKLVVLTAFIPMLMDTGGNSGSQASVTIIRGLSLGEIGVKDVFKVMWKEFRVSILCGISLAAAAFLKVILIDGLLMGNSDVSVTVALVVALTLWLTVICAKLIGCSLPIVAKKLGFDPAVMASPFITTIVDAVSLLVYFGFAKMFLPI